MKIFKLICVTLVLSLALCLNSCVNDQRSEDLPEITEETTPEPTTASPIFETAEDLYNLLAANKPVWEREYMISGTLIDLDFDGTPEFLLTHKGFSPSLSIFKFDGEIIKEIKTIEHIYVEKVFTEFRAIVPYIDESGAKSWVIPYAVYSDDYGTPGSYYDYHLSAFNFTDENITETVKFGSRVYCNVYNDAPYLGYPYFNTEFYIDGIEYLASQDKLDKFWNEMDRIVREHIEAITDDNPLGAGYPWNCGGYYPNPSQAEWEDTKTEFINDLLSAESAYNLFPGIDSEYIWSGMDGSWKDEQSIDSFIRKLAEAYVVNDESYLRTLELFYDNGGAMCKPVIYLYPTKPTDISVRVDFPNGGDFTCTYPDYGNGWNVTAYPDGTVINKADGLEYSYLYWEGEGNTKWDFSSGFVVEGSDTAAFLREKLAYLGLTPREYNEFIVYWLPLMQNNSYNLITFQTAAYEESAQLYVSPKPDSILRVFMAYNPLENAVNIPEQHLEQFERMGFSVIEWGGTCVK